MKLSFAFITNSKYACAVHDAIMKALQHCLVELLAKLMLFTASTKQHALLSCRHRESVLRGPRAVAEGLRQWYVNDACAMYNAMMGIARCTEKKFPSTYKISKVSHPPAPATCAFPITQSETGKSS